MMLFNMWGILPHTKENSQKYIDMKTVQGYMNHLSFMYSSALYTFEWENLPETCSERFFEMALLGSGQAVIMKDKETGAFISLPCGGATKYTMYGDVTEVWAYGMNGTSKHCKVWVPHSTTPGDGTYDGVVCYDNDVRYPYSFFIAEMAMRINDLFMATDVSAENLKRPVIIAVNDDSQKSTVDRFLESRGKNLSSIVISDKNLTDMAKRIATLPLNNSPESLKALTEHIEWVENYYQTKMGVKSVAQTNKKERLIVDEANANDKITALNVQKRLKCREYFCEQFNLAFGTNISVKLREVETDDSNDNVVLQTEQEQDTTTTD